MKANKLSLSVLILIGAVSSNSIINQKNFSQLRHHDNNLFLQLQDHNNDTEDIPDGLDPVLVQLNSKTNLNDHLNDTDDIPDGMDPVLLQLKSKLKDHQNDTEDIPEG